MHALVQQLNHFCKLSKDSLDALTSVLVKKELPKNSYLITEGKVCDHTYFLEKGCLRGYYNLDGKEVTYWFGFENHFVTSFYSFISRKPCFENIQLLEDSVLWAISYSDLQNLYSTYPEIERLGRIVNEQYYVTLEERFVSNHFRESKERYEALLNNSPHILQRIPLGYIASYLGISQETLSRIRSKP